VAVVPNGVNPRAFSPDVRAAAISTGKRFRFLWVGGATRRKGCDILLSAYERGFKDSDDVCLVIKDASVYGGDLVEAVRKFRARAGAPEILHLTEDMTPSELPSLYKACQALVAPYRGEGYGLPIAEAMATGLPVLVTGYGGALQFARAETADLLRFRLLTRGLDGIDGYGTAGIPYLAECDVEELSSRMKEVFENEEEARRLGERAARDIRAHHTWAHSARRAAVRLAALADREGLWEPTEQMLLEAKSA
jgi:glycosyltransferase involved in cell wall biosynthesis